MTSINAIRFNRYEGALICDESIGMTDDMRMDVCDKIVPCIPEIITKKYGIVAAMGGTGTCAVGDEIKQTFSNKVLSLYEEEVEKHGKAPGKFIHLKEMARMLFDVIVDVKYQDMNHKFMSNYGFSVSEFMEGSYTRGKNTFDIKDK